MQASQNTRDRRRAREGGRLSPRGSPYDAKKPYRPELARAVAVILALPILVFAGLIVLFRSRSPLLIAVVRQLNKYAVNRAMLLLAGHRGWYASVARHVGRRTGRPYATPIVAEPAENGFIIPLPYGTDVDWLRNVLAAEQFTLERNGVTYVVGEPVVLPWAEAERLLTPSRRFAFRVFGVRQCLRVRTLAVNPAAERN